ncbi:sphingosine-1-phosphate phosphatase 1-like, partial [Plectropomus leopardus]
MEKSNRFVELYHYLQDPHLVARFQRFCGVHGTFSRTVCAGTKDRTHSQNNGACHHHSAGNEGENLAVIGAGEGEIPTRKRVIDSEVANISEKLPQNGAVVSTATAGGETVGLGSNGRRVAGATEPEQREKESGAPGCSTVKPRRKNSLTGDAGQEFLIQNRFLYYMFTFGTELGNELFYITFFPFVIWSIDAFVGRRLIMVWVWVMYLGQCTKDVLGWSRPASPPVVKVEVFYNSEYSMPSTHAMSGTAIPFSLFFMTYGRWE